MKRVQSTHDTETPFVWSPTEPISPALPARLQQPLTIPSAFMSPEFLASRSARSIRVLCEFQETLSRLRKQGVLGTFVLFGSARAMDGNARVAAIEKATADGDANKVSRLEKVAWLERFVADAEALGRVFTEWAHGCDHDLCRLELLGRGNYLSKGEAVGTAHASHFVVCTGGGPGLMEAASKGASSVPGGRTMGLGIKLPFESGLNPFVTPKLAFSFQYFFTRKFWMMYPAVTLVAAPGGFGTLDELLEAMTLKLNGRTRTMPIVLLGKDFWSHVIDWEGWVKAGVIDAEDLQCFHIVDNAGDRFYNMR